MGRSRKQTPKKDGPCDKKLNASISPRKRRHPPLPAHLKKFVSPQQESSSCETSETEESGFALTAEFVNQALEQSTSNAIDQIRNGDISKYDFLNIANANFEKKLPIIFKKSHPNLPFWYSELNLHKSSPNNLRGLNVRRKGQTSDGIKKKVITANDNTKSPTPDSASSPHPDQRACRNSAKQRKTRKNLPFSSSTKKSVLTSAQPQPSTSNALEPGTCHFEVSKQRKRDTPQEQLDNSFECLANLEALQTLSNGVKIHLPCLKISVTAADVENILMAASAPEKGQTIQKKKKLETKETSNNSPSNKSRPPSPIFGRKKLETGETAGVSLLAKTDPYFQYVQQEKYYFNSLESSATQGEASCSTSQPSTSTSGSTPTSSGITSEMQLQESNEAGMIGDSEKAQADVNQDTESMDYLKRSNELLKEIQCNPVKEVDDSYNDGDDDILLDYPPAIGNHEQHTSDCDMLKDCFSKGKVCTLPQPTAKRLFDTHKSYLTAIYHQTVYCKRHQEFYSSREKCVTMRHADGSLIFSSDTLEKFARFIGRHISSNTIEHSFHLPYVFYVLLPELINKIIMDVYSIGKREAVKKKLEIAERMATSGQNNKEHCFLY